MGTQSAVNATLKMINDEFMYTAVCITVSQKLLDCNEWAPIADVLYEH